MKFLADENIPSESIEALRKAGFDIESIGESAPGSSDADVAARSKRTARVVVTFDKGFAEDAFRGLVRPHGMIFLRVQPSSPEYITKNLQRALGPLPDLTDKLCIVELHRFRIIPLNKGSWAGK
jgi:predicted nuclease of predicted toxin-antitoxin system